MNVQKFDFSVNLMQAILWQYNQATTLMALVSQKQTWYTDNQTDFWNDWYTNVFNLLTANSFGLSVWSYILDVPLYIAHDPEPADKPIWGFSPRMSGTLVSGTNTITGLSSTAFLTVGQGISDGNVNIPLGTTIASIVSSSSVTMSNNAVGSATENIIFLNGLNFGNSNFSTRGQVITLTEEEQRFLLRLRYFQLCTRGDVTDINAFLNYLITTSNIGYTGTLYVLDGLNMSITYVFTGANFPRQLLNVMTRLDILPRPAGVGIKIHINYGDQWGFNAIVGSRPNYENRNQNFGNGNFLAPFITGG